MKPPASPKCAFDTALKAVVHRFALGADTCECGAERIEKPSFKPLADPWRQSLRRTGKKHKSLDE